MTDYKGIKCPVCDVPFKDNDDIVVCPICGAPYHRNCYNKEEHCIYEDEHASGKVWEAPKPPVAPDTSAEIKDNECPTCGLLNAHSALFCSRCGSSLTGEPHVHNNTGTGPNIPFEYRTFGGGIPIVFDSMGGVSPTEKLDDNVTFGDISKLVKQNTAYYMPVFRNQEKYKRNRFNFAAFLFSGPWMLYRKQYKRGAIITILMFSFYIAYIATSLFITTPTLIEAMKMAGLDALTYENLYKISAIMVENPNMFLRILPPFICNVCMFIIMLICGIKGNKWYKNYCVSTIKNIKATENPNDISSAIETKSGVNTAIAICMMISYMILSTMPSFF